MVCDMFSKDSKEFRPWEKGCKAFILVLVVGLAIRLFFIPFTSSPFDVAAGWVAVVDGTYSGDTIYESGWYFYPPVWGYILSILSGVADVIGMGSFGDVFPSIYEGQVLTIGHGMLTNMGFNILVKIPALIFDVLAGVVAYEIVKRLTGDQKKAVIGFALWFLAPVVIMSSSILCMFDSIMMFLMMLSLLTFMDKRYFLTGMLLSMAFLTKVFAIVIVPVMIAYILSEYDLDLKKRMRNLLYAASGFILMCVIIYLPAIVMGEFQDSLWFFTSRESAYGGSFSWSPSFNNVFFYFPFLAVGYLAIFAYMLTRRENRERTFLWLMVLSIIPIFSLPFVAYTPTYGITILPAILILYSFKGRVALIPWVLLAVYAFHGIAHYWETMFYPMAAYLDFLDVNSIVESSGSRLFYSAVLFMMFTPGISIFLIMLYYMLKQREVSLWTLIQRRSA